MIDENVILKSIEDAIIKCTNSSKKAIARGSNVTRENHRKTFTLKYEDGTTITFDKNSNVQSLVIDGVEYNYKGSESYETFGEHQSDLVNLDGKTMDYVDDVWYDMDDNRQVDTHEIKTSNAFEFCSVYANQYASLDGMFLNDLLFSGKKLTNNLGEDEYSGVIFNKSNHDYFVELERKSRCDFDNILAVRFEDTFHTSDNIDKEYYTNKGHTGFTVCGDLERCKDSFGSIHDDGWLILNVIPKNSNARGLFLGNMINNARGYNSDWEGELNIPPQTKFVRDLIDEDNHIVIQHIEYQRSVS